MLSDATFFNAPITFSVELVRLGMGLLVLFGLAAITHERGHIAVDIVESLAPEKVLAMFRALAAVCGAVFISLIAWRLWDRSTTFYGDGRATDVLFLPVWPVVLLMALAAAVAALIAITQIAAPNSQDERAHSPRETEL